MKRVQSAECRMQTEMQKQDRLARFTLIYALCILHLP